MDGHQRSITRWKPITLIFIRVAIGNMCSAFSTRMSIQIISVHISRSPGTINRNVSQWAASVALDVSALFSLRWWIQLAQLSRRKKHRTSTIRVFQLCKTAVLIDCFDRQTQTDASRTFPRISLLRNKSHPGIRTCDWFRFKPKVWLPTFSHMEYPNLRSSGFHVVTTLMCEWNITSWILLSKKKSSLNYSVPTASKVPILREQLGPVLCFYPRQSTCLCWATHVWSNIRTSPTSFSTWRAIIEVN